MASATRRERDLCADVDLRPRPPAPVLEAIFSRSDGRVGLRRVNARVFMARASRLSKCLMQRCRIQRGYAIAGSSQDTAIARLALVVYCRYSPESAKCPSELVGIAVAITLRFWLTMWALL